jgi:phosphoglycolate phosphatase (TIGR01487 family)
MSERTDPPLAVDIDGTLTNARQELDPRVFEVLRSWTAPVVIATGKGFPYPVALCEFLKIPTNVIAENGGVVTIEATESLTFNGDREAAQAVVDDYVAAGYDVGFGALDFPNRWRGTEVNIHVDSPEKPLREIAAEHGMKVFDTGFAYHVVSPGVSKGAGLETAAAELDLDPADFAYVGDSENDVAAFEVAGRAVAVANADDAALAAADTVTEGSYGDGFLEAARMLRP